MSIRSFLILAVCSFLAFGYWRKHISPARGTPEAQARMREISEEIQQLSAEREVYIKQQSHVRTEAQLHDLHQRCFKIDAKVDYLKAKLANLQ